MKTKDFTGIRNQGPLPSPQEMSLPDDVFDLLDDYIESTACLLEDLEQATLSYESRVDRSESEAVIKRLLHKLKGEAGIVGLEDIGEFCHQAESAFEELPDNKRPDMLFRFKDWMHTAVSNLKE